MDFSDHLANFDSLVGGQGGMSQDANSPLDDQERVIEVPIGRDENRAPKKPLQYQKANEFDQKPDRKSGGDQIAALKGKNQDKETADIKDLLGQFDKAGKEGKSDRFAAGMSEAGMEFGHAFGGDPVDKGYIDRLYRESERKQERVKERQALKESAHKSSQTDMNQDVSQLQAGQGFDQGQLNLNKSTDEESDRRRLEDGQSDISRAAVDAAKSLGIEVPPGTSAKDIFTIYPMVKDKVELEKGKQANEASLIKERETQTAADARDKVRQDAENGRASRHESGENYRSMLGIGAKQGQADEKNSEKLGELHIPGTHIIGWENGERPSIGDHTEATKEQASWDSVKPVMQKIITTLKSNPRNLPQSKAWQEMSSDMAFAAPLKNRMAGSGVVNGKDWEHVIQEMGNPNGLMQFVNEGGLTKLENSMANTKNQYEKTMRAHHYAPGEMDQRGSNRQAGSGGFSGGNDLRVTPEAAAEAYRGTGLGPAPGLQSRQNATPGGSQRPSQAPVQNLTESGHQTESPDKAKWLDLLRSK